MFWNSKKKGKEKLSNEDRVKLIRKRLSDHVTDGDKTQFDITHCEERTGVNEHGEYEFTVTNIARVNYDVTEWTDLTSADRDTRRALRKVTDDDITTNIDDTEEDLSKTDYWATR